MRQRRNMLLRPLSARSVVASTLLGCHPPELPTGALVEMGKLYGVAEGTLRVALSRMLAAGELAPVDGGYRLAGSILGRQARQEEGWHPVLREWSGAWSMAVVVTAGRSAPARAELRAAMAALRMAELREGIWLRPDNLDPQRLAAARAVADVQCRWFDVHPSGNAQESTRLAAELWNLDAWARRAEKLRREMSRLVDRIESADFDHLGPAGLVSVAVVQHFVRDPLLPPALVPATWPGAGMRADYERFNAALRKLLSAWARAQRTGARQNTRSSA